MAILINEAAVVPLDLSNRTEHSICLVSHDLSTLAEILADPYLKLKLERVSHYDGSGGLPTNSRLQAFPYGTSGLPEWEAISPITAVIQPAILFGWDPQKLKPLIGKAVDRFPGPDFYTSARHDRAVKALLGSARLSMQSLAEMPGQTVREKAARALRSRTFFSLGSYYLEFAANTRTLFIVYVAPIPPPSATYDGDISTITVNLPSTTALDLENMGTMHFDLDQDSSRERANFIVDYLANPNILPTLLNGRGYKLFEHNMVLRQDVSNARTISPPAHSSGGPLNVSVGLPEDPFPTVVVEGLGGSSTGLEPCTMLSVGRPDPTDPDSYVATTMYVKQYAV